MLSDLPTEVLTDIFQYCDPTIITGICRQFTTIVHTRPSFWSSVNLRSSQFVSEGPRYLHQRLQRAGTSPLRITIGPIHPKDTLLPVVTQICQTLGEFNSRIQLLEITAKTSLFAGIIIREVFSTPIAFPTLESLSIRVVEDYEWPHLRAVLGCAVVWFPMLQTFSITAFDCIPRLPEHFVFAHLHTLILDGSIEPIGQYIGAMVALLYSTPRLETLWLKHYTREQNNVTVDNLTYRNRKIHIPVPLPRLTSLSIAVPGCGADITGCIDAPALRDLHMDGSRGPGETECDDEINWSDWDAESVLDSLKHLSKRSQHLRRLATTSTYFTVTGWQWLLFGEGQGPPFPQLECLALHGLDESSGEISCGFNDALLLQYSQEPSICLNKLTILRCSFPLSGMALVQAIKAKPFELVYDQRCPQFSGDEINTVVDLKVILCRRQEWEVKEDEWWTRGHQIDASDSHVY